MMIFISDLHFRDEKKWSVNDHATEGFINKSLIPAIVDAKARQVTVVFVGDVVDINRSPYWLEGNEGTYKPWSHWRETLNEIKKGSVPEDPGFHKADFENCILTVLERIRAANTASYRLWKEFKDVKGVMWEKEGFKPDSIRLEFVAGNHDRLSQYSPATRDRLVENLSLEPVPQTGFPWLKFDEPHRVVAFHGHVLDDMNYGERTSQPADYIASPWYRFPSLGDVATLTFGVMLYHEFKVNQEIHDMLAEVDLLRPQAEIFPWLESKIALYPDLKTEIDKILARLAREYVTDPFVRWNMKWWEKLVATVVVAFRLPKTIGQVKFLFKVLPLDDKPKEKYTEEMITKISTGDFARWLKEKHLDGLNVVSGHTHLPLVVPLKGDESQGPFASVHYFNTGSWLPTIEGDLKRGYARRGQIAHAMFYQSGEDVKPDKTRSYWEYWEGSLKQVNCSAE